MALVYRAVIGRLHSDDLVVFTLNEPEDDLDNATWRGRIGRFVSKFKEGWKNDTSLFSWANKGQWETVEAANEETVREADSFRIGFEPLFVDFTQSGAWFIVLTLIQVRSISKNLYACFEACFVLYKDSQEICNIALHTKTCNVSARRYGEFFMPTPDSITERRA